MLPRELLDQFTVESPAMIALNLILSAILSWILSLIYVKFGQSLSNRRAFSSNFYLVAMTITLIITIVKSSLALSLGLVGALSIVRYRAAIKEPEELAYLFITIGIGLGIGANQQVITVIAFILLVLAIIFHTIFVSRHKQYVNQNYNLSILFPPDMSSVITAREIESAIRKIIPETHLKRFESSNQGISVALRILYKTAEEIDSISTELKKMHSDVKIIFLDNIEV